MSTTMKKMGVWLALAIALIMGFAAISTSAANTAFAADATPSVNVTYKGIQSGDTLDAYKVVSFSGDNNNSYEYDATFAAFLTASTDDGGMGYSSASDFEKLGFDSDEVKNVLNKFRNYKGFDSLTPSITQTSTSTSVSAGFTPGYYLAAPTTGTGNNTVYSASSLFVRYNGNSDLLVYGNGTKLTATDGKYEVNAKSQNGATIEKSIARANGTWATTKTVAMGEYVQYGLKITLPDYSGIAFDLDVQVDDTLTNLQFVTGDDAHPVKAYAGTDQASGTAFDGVTVTAGEYDATTHTQKLNFKIDYSSLKGTGEKTLMISYWALPTTNMVATGAMNGTNSAKLSYKTTSDDDSRYATAASNTTVYTYGMKLTKFGSLSNTTLAGAEFELYADATTTQPMRFVPVYKTGSTSEIAYYRYTTTNEAGSTTTLAVNDEGTFEVRGIDGTSSKPVYVKETKTPQGYAAPSGRFIATLNSATDADTGEHNGKLTDGTFAAENTADSALAKSASVDVDNQWQLDVQLNNANTNALPTTGGMGTVIFAVAGIALMLVAAGAFVVLRRRRQQ